MNRFKSFIIDKNIISELYYVLVVLGYTLTLFAAGMRPGVFATALMLGICLILLMKKSIKPQGVCDYIVITFLVYELLSVIWLRKGGFPLSVFTEEFISSVLPIIFYFVGKAVSDRCENWYKWYLIAMLVLGILGVILYAWAPQFYNDWSYDWSYISKADAQTTRVRMNSVVGSTCLSFNMVAGMLAASYFLGKREKKSNLVFGISSLVLCLLFAILANQRSGLVAAALVIVYVNYLLFFQLNLIPKKYFMWELIIAAAAFALLCVVRFDFVLKFWYRIISLPTAISERSEQWIAAVNNMYSTWLGNGLGANGHRALGIEGAHVIADGGLVKLYCENGVLGFSIWVYLIILTVKKGLKNVAAYYTELGIVAIGLLQSIGSNMLAFQFCAPIFWYAIGRICETGEEQ